MKIDEFIKKYNNAKDKRDFLSNSLVVNHIPYVEKIADCQRVVDATSTLDGIFKLNTPVRAAFFSVNMISKFFGIDIEDSNLIDIYEKLDEINLVNELMSIIPERERETYYAILGMVNDDYFENNRSIISFIETKLNTIGLSVDALLSGITEIINKQIDNETEES